MSNSVFTFQTLHPDTIMDAPFEHGIRVDSGLTPLNSYEDRVYQFQDEDRRRLVVKFYRPGRWAADQTLEEHQFALQLISDEVPVAAPVAFNGQTLLNHQGFYLAVFPSVGDRQFGADSIDQMEAVGCYLRRMHQTGCKQPFIHRSTIGLGEYLIKPRELSEDATLIPSGLKAALLKATDELTAAVTIHWRGDFTVLRLHGDCHAGNIPWHDGPVFVDLDDARNGPAVQGLWMLLNSGRAEQRTRLKTIIEAYEGFSEFGTAEIEPIGPSHAMRLVYCLAQLMRYWADPTSPKNFPWLAGEDYWLRQMVTFMGQAKVLQEPSLQLTSIY